MKTIVIIEMNNDGSYTAVPQHDFEIGFFGEGKTVEEAIADLDNSFGEARCGAAAHRSFGNL